MNNLGAKLLIGIGWIIGILIGLLALGVLVAVIIYPVEYVRRIITWGESDVGDYLYNFPQRPLKADPQIFYFEKNFQEERVSAIFEDILGVSDFDAFLVENDTTAFIVIQDDAILYEKYFNGAQRDSLMTSFSMAKSFTSALVGIAISEGYILSVDDPITLYLPELVARDPRFNAITIRNVLMMASGLEYKEFRPLLFNSDDPLTSYYPDQRYAALEFTRVLDPPGEYFLYNKYHPQLLGMILERTTGVPVTTYLQEKLWTPLGMEFNGSWSLDSLESGFEKMETGVNARAIDYAKFGQLFLQNGSWEGAQLIPAEWVAESTQVDPATYNSNYYRYYSTFHEILRGYYSYMWWGLLREQVDDHSSYDFTAEGDRGQFIYISPANNMVIVRNGTTWGFLKSDLGPSIEWNRAFYRFAGEY